MSRGQLGLVLRHLQEMLGDQSADKLTDRALLGRFAQLHDETAFEALVERHGPMVMGVCRRVLGDAHAVEDAFQATFLVLARKAGARGWHDSIGNWLYGVALRTARKAKARALRRQSQERQAASMPSTDPSTDRLSQKCQPDADPVSEAVRREFRALLDEELMQLPDKYRAPLVLCYLEGKTTAEAAQALGWPTGSMSRHLARGRELLRARLTSRGVALSGPSLTVLLAHSAAPAALPVLLVTSTVQVALGGMAGCVSSEITTLAEGVLKAMLLSKLKLAAVVLLAIVGLGLGAGSVRQFLQAADAPAPVGKKDVPKVALAAKADAAKEPAGPTAQARAMRRQLAKQIDLPDGIPANSTLGDALAFLAEKPDVVGDGEPLTFVVNTRAFEQALVPKAEEHLVTLPKMKKVRLSTVLGLLAGQVKGEKYGGTFIVRDDYIEITTTHDVMREVLGAEFEESQFPDGFGREAFPITSVDITKQPLQDALRQLASEENVNIVLDPRVGDKAKAEVSATMNNVTLGTALRLLADMADLKMVRVNNVFYVTTKANAETVEAEQTKRRAKIMPPVAGSDTKK